MKVYGIDIPDDKGLTNFDLQEYAPQELGISHFRDVFMRDTLLKTVDTWMSIVSRCLD